MPPPKSVKVKPALLTIALVLGLLAVRLFAKQAFDYVVIGYLLLTSLAIVWHDHL